MNIVHFSTNDFGGAGLAAVRIHEECMRDGINSKLYVLNKSNEVVPDIYSERIIAKKFFFSPINRTFNLVLKFLLKNRNSFYSIANKRGMLSFKRLNEIIQPNVDLVVIHWVSGFIDLKMLMEINKIKPIKVVFYLMDMGMITGGCHFSHGCEGYRLSCSNCPETSNEFIRKMISDNFFNLIKYSINIKPYSIASSQYLLNQSKESSVYFKDYFMTKPPLTSVFKNLNLIKSNKKIIRLLLGAYKANDERKGYKYALMSLNILDTMIDGSGLEVLIMVPNRDIEEDLRTFKNIEIETYEFAKKSEDLALLYNKADLLLNTSQDDSGPMLVLESQMCGLPFIATSVGVAREISKKYTVNGVVTEPTNYKEMANLIYDFILNQDEISRDVISSNAKKYYCDFNSNVENFKKIYDL